MSASKVSFCVFAVLVAVAIVAANPLPGGYGGGHSNIYRKDHGYDNYDFGYDIGDHYTGDRHGRKESKRGYNVVGSYYDQGPVGYGRKVNYVADHYGTHATVIGSPNGLYIHSKDLTVVPGYH